jgi:hypothetical protein
MPINVPYKLRLHALYWLRLTILECALIAFTRRALSQLNKTSCTQYVEVMDATPPMHLYSPVYTRPLNHFGSQLSVNALNRITSRLLNRFVNHVWEVV